MRASPFVCPLEIKWWSGYDQRRSRRGRPVESCDTMHWLSSTSSTSITGVSQCQYPPGLQYCIGSHLLPAYALTSIPLVCSLVTRFSSPSLFSSRSSTLLRRRDLP